MRAHFKSHVDPPKPHLKQVKVVCCVDHFNWYQIVVHDDQPPPPWKAPYIDPPKGGYDGDWHDKLPWFWDEGLDYPRGYYLPGLRKYNEFDDIFNFSDGPVNPGKQNVTVTFKVWLVGVDKDNKLVSWFNGFTWTWKKMGNQSSVTEVAFNDTPPTQAEYQDLLKRMGFG
jgi:hypothetical protein